MNRLLIPLVALSLSTAAAAAPQYFEARNTAMGGTGVASSRYLSAGLANPALLTQFGEGDDFGLLLPAVGALGADDCPCVRTSSSSMTSIDSLWSYICRRSGMPHPWWLRAMSWLKPENWCWRAVLTRSALVVVKCGV